jgi:hypothetical protein
MRVSVLLLAVLMGGCSLDNTSDAATDNRPGADPYCAAVAAGRATDAAENGIEKPMGNLIYSDAYRRCIESPAKFQRGY